MNDMSTNKIEIGEYNLRAITLSFFLKSLKNKKIKIRVRCATRLRVHNTFNSSLKCI